MDADSETETNVFLLAKKKIWKEWQDYSILPSDLLLIHMILKAINYSQLFNILRNMLVHFLAKS